MTDLLIGQLENASPASVSLLSSSVPIPTASSTPVVAVSSTVPRPYRFSTSPTLTLSLTSAYAPHWTKREGVRELVQNWYDGCNANLRSLNQRSAANSPTAATASPAAYSLTINRSSSSSSSHVLYQATASTSHGSRPQLHLGSILHHSPSNTLSFHNNAVSLSRAILLLGHTSKRAGSGSGGSGSNSSGGGDVGMVGSFGEGMKVGMLALLREGCRCWMGTRGEVWQFDFYHDDNYGETLLGVWTSQSERRQNSSNSAAEERAEEAEVDADAACSEQDRAEWLSLSELQRQERVVLRAMLDARKSTDTTTVLSGISTDDWSSFQHDFLFLSSTAPADIVTTPLGSILLSSSHQHCLYVKGFLVASFPNDLVYGVDLREAKLDRDRKAVLQTSELHRLVGSIWAQAVSAQPALLDKYFDLLLHHSSSAESKNAEFYLTAQTIENVASTFFALHGHDSQPVLNSSGDDAVFISSQLSRRPVLVPAALYDILTRSNRIQPVDSLIAQHQAHSAQQVALSALSPQQLHCIQSAVRLVQTIAPLFTVEEVAVTSFADEEGVWCKEEETAGGSGSGSSSGSGSGITGGRAAGKVLLDSRCLDLQKVHERWGDCGLEERRVQQGKGKGVSGLVAMAECSCREAAIAALIVKETRRVRWRNGAASHGGGNTAVRRRGGDAIMEHLARGRESELLMVNLLERTVRRAESERLRRQNLEEEKQIVLQHLQHRATTAERQQQQQLQLREEHKTDVDGKEWEASGDTALNDEQTTQQPRHSDLSLLTLQHELELSRAELHRQQQLATQHSLDSQSTERLLRSTIAEVSGQSLIGAAVGVSDERLLELERLHVSALSELQRVREERRRRVAEVEDERRKRSECGVCMSRAIDCVLLPCRHANVCYECARKMDKCGVCRQRIADRIQYFE